MNLQQIILKQPFTGAHVKYERIGGIDYQVYPCVMLVEGVHQGVDSEPVYYSPGILSESAPAWNNLPVTIGHPVNQQGEHVLCNTDGKIREGWQVGYIANARFEDGKLKADLYLNVQRVNGKQPHLLAHLHNGGELQVSTGMLAGLNSTTGTWNEEEYTGTVTAIVPDHLALLPGTNGACSWDDGCGVRVNANKHIGGQTMSEEKEKCCPERVLALIENEVTPFNSDDTEWLEMCNEDQLAKLETYVALVAELSKEEEPQVATVAELRKEEEVTLESYLEAAPVQIRAVLNEGMKALDAKRQVVIDRIMNHEGNGFSAEQLKAMDTEMLEGISKLIPEKKTSYAGANPRNAVVLSDERTEEPYVPVTLSDKLIKK